MDKSPHWQTEGATQFLCYQGICTWLAFPDNPCGKRRPCELEGSPVPGEQCFPAGRVMGLGQPVRQGSTLSLWTAEGDLASLVQKVWHQIDNEGVCGNKAQAPGLSSLNIRHELDGYSILSG